MGRKLRWNQGPLTEMSSRRRDVHPQDEGKGEERDQKEKEKKGVM